jgi:hypothetical protein
MEEKQVMVVMDHLKEFREEPKLLKLKIKMVS